MDGTKHSNRSFIKELTIIENAKAQRSLEEQVFYDSNKIVKKGRTFGTQRFAIDCVSMLRLRRTNKKLKIH